MGTFTISSTAFKPGGPIPSKYTCDGPNVNPLLVIEGVPANAQSLALIMDDPDAPGATWVHWVVWNIQPATKAIREDTVPPEASQGVNDFQNPGYGGPCPPSGTHRYFFRLYALNTSLDLGPDTTRAGLEDAMEGHILDQAELVGRYGRR
ncbi:MAG TPA: YbhB/YbcL family Raf kinase inhibitor-like protein [Nitrospiraceae bacterium]|nr:YbhB/YbcL family Raf kinase inhibitor-like protein [Nitrospiraceae bacterium]